MLNFVTVEILFLSELTDVLCLRLRALLFLIRQNMFAQKLVFKVKRLKVIRKAYSWLPKWLPQDSASLCA